MAVTLHFQSTGTVPGDGKPSAMVGHSLTVGRGDENDLVLPDPDKMVSKRHCAIEDREGNVVVIDFSTNGTFLNYGKTPLGQTPTPLNDGDILTIGTYELMVDIPVTRASDPLADLPPPVEEEQVSHGRAEAAPEVMNLLDDPSDKVDFLDDLLGEGKAATGPSGVVRDRLGDDGLMPPLGEDNDGILERRPGPDVVTGASQPRHNPSIEDSFQTPRPSVGTIPDDWADDLLEDDSSAQDNPFGQQDEEPVPAQAPNAPGDAPAHSVATIVPSAKPVRQTSGDDAARAFLKTAGVGNLEISDGDLVPTLSRLGHVMRIMIHGMREILMTRTSIKSEFRISQTVITSGGNNPLKFSVSPEQAVEAMVKPTSEGYLDATAAAEQALKDIRAHEIAMMTGMEAALKGVLTRLDPSELESKIKSDAGLRSVLKNKKAQYWETYEKMYAEISDQAENDFHELFSKEFARAYQAQLERLK